MRVEAALREKHAERFAAAKRKGRGVHMSFILTPTGLRSLSDRSPARDGRDIERVTRVADRSLRDPSQVVADRELMTRAMTGLVGVDRRIFRLVVIDGRTLAEAGRELALTRQAVWGRWQRLRARLAASPRLARLVDLVAEDGAAAAGQATNEPAAGNVSAAVA
jgi:DNA-directed RNA polymerase specialized sigma24 family protein